MSIFCFDCVENVVSGSSVLTVLTRIAAVVIASLALFIARRNLKTVANSHSVQAQMNMINLEKDLRVNRKRFKAALAALSQAINNSSLVNAAGPNSIVYLEYQTSFEDFMFSSDKLALLINEGLLDVHFKDRDWKSQYSGIFSEVQESYKWNQLKGNPFEKIENLQSLMLKWKD